MSAYDSDNESFKSAEDGLEVPPNVNDTRFPPEEEAALLSDSNERKSLANNLFGKASYDEAIQNYDKALSFCPNYLEYEIAVLRSNIAACHIKLEDWKAAVDSATKSLECLERLDPTSKTTAKGLKNGSGQDGSAVVEEVDDETAEKIEALQNSGRTREEVQKLRVKALLRRAKARTELGGWSNLQGADEDYKLLASMQELSPTDRRRVQTALRVLPPKLNAAKDHEMGEMMGKLKDLGNGILKPFGLSTSNFNFVQDEKTGGYSMQFNQDVGSSKK